MLAGVVPCPAAWKPFLKVNDPALDERVLYFNACTIGVFRMWVFLLIQVFLLIGCFVPSRLVPFVTIANIACRYITRICLGLDVHETSEPSSSQASTVVSNHVSMWDGYAIMGQGHHLIFVATASVTRLPVIGRACAALGCLFVDRKNGGSRHEVQSKIEEFQRTSSTNPIGNGERKSKQLLIFSEGTCTNQSGVLRLKLGAFRGLRPVQPLRIQYSLRHLAFVAMASEIAAAGLSLCLPRSRISITWLPVVVPMPGETPEEFSERVRKSILVPGLPALEEAYGDNLALEEFVEANA